EGRRFDANKPTGAQLDAHYPTARRRGLRHRRAVAAEQEADALTVERVAHRLEMHQMGCAANLDVALDRRRREGIEQPTRVLVRDHAIPFAANDCDRRVNKGRIVGELAVPGMDDVVERPGRNLDADRVVPAAVRIAVEVALAPRLEMRAR